MKSIKIYKDKENRAHFQSDFESYETIGLLETMREMIMLTQARTWLGDKVEIKKQDNPIVEAERN